MRGRMLINQPLLASKNQLIDTKLVKGMYLIEVKTADGVKQMKWVIE